MNFNNMLMGSEQQFHQLLKEWSILPDNDAGANPTPLLEDDPVNVGNKIARKVVVGAAAADARLTGTTQYTSINLKKVAKGNKIAYVELQRWKRIQQKTSPGKSLNEGGNTIVVDAEAAPALNRVPVWFLPWETGSSVRITIPDAATVHAPNDSHIFFTAAINGCSIFFQGTTRNPTIFHSGGSPGYADANDTAAFWQAVNDEFIASDTALGKNKGALHGTSVDKRHYVAQPGVTATLPSGMVVKTTNRAMLFQQSLSNKHQTGRLRIEEVFPWGCVLGRRDGTGNWKFWLQENATIVYHQLSRNPFSKTTHTVGRVSVPLIYREVFPGGAQHLTIRRKLPKVI